MKYRKATRLDDMLGYYDPEKDLIVVDFSNGLFIVLSTSYHEVFHKLASKFGVQDWVDVLSPLLRLSTYKNRQFRLWFKLIFQKAEVMPEYDDQWGHARSTFKKCGRH